jgi:hypothetical protein
MIKILFLFLFIFCKPADPNYRLKPLLNTEYTGFISRSFFQVIVEVPVTREEVSILEEREICKKESFLRRDKIIIPLLKAIAVESKLNESARSQEKYFENKDSEKDTDINSYKIIRPETSKIKKNMKPNINAKNTYLNKGEFTWFLDTMFLYSEDYKTKDKCIFIYRKIEKDLFDKVSLTPLGIIGEDPLVVEPTPNSANPNIQTQNPQGIPGTNPQGTQTGTPTGLPTGIPTIGR